MSAPLRGRWRARGHAPLLVLLVLLASGCGLLGAEEPADVASTPAPGTTSSADSSTPSDAPPPDEPPPPAPPAQPPAAPQDLDGFPTAAQIAAEGPRIACDALTDLFDDDYCTDTDENGWPDFVETEAGFDPAAEDCGQAECGASLEEIALRAQANTLFILDASGSMAGDAGGQTKMAAAKTALVDFAVASPEFSDLGLMVYGHRGDNSDAGMAESCAGIETFAPVGSLGFETVEATVAGFQPTGWTPIAASLEAAGPLLAEAAAADAAAGFEGTLNRVVLISDGLETCGGDPVAAAEALTTQGIDVIVDVIGFDLAEGDRGQLAAVAEITGGTYTDVADGAGLEAALAVLNANFYESADALNCALRSSADFFNCRFELDRAAYSFHFDRATTEAREISPEAERLVFAWADATSALFTGETTRVQEQIQPQVEEYQRLVDEAAARIAERDVSYSGAVRHAVAFSCPAGEVPAGRDGDGSGTAIA